MEIKKHKEFFSSLPIVHSLSVIGSIIAIEARSMWLFIVSIVLSIICMSVALYYFRNSTLVTKPNENNKRVRKVAKYYIIISLLLLVFLIVTLLLWKR